MAITKAAQKSLRQNIKRKVKNLKKRNELKDLIKELKVLISDKKADEAKKLLPKVYKLLDKAAKTGLIKKNNASRKKSRISKLINKTALK